MSEPGEITNEEAIELADEILLRGEFLGAREPGFFSRSVDWLIEQVLDLLGRLLGSLFGGSGSGAGSVIAYVLLGVAVVVIAVALYKAFRSARAGEDEGEQERGARVVFDEVVDPVQLRRELAGRRAAGDWRGAVIAGFRLAIVALIDDRVATERPGATTGDFGREVARNRPDASGTYDRAATVFERAFYSDNEIDEVDFTRVHELLDRLVRVATP